MGGDAERFETVVIGGGQAGLSVGHHLARRNLSFVILDACERIGDSWRKRWDSLHLFTPARFNALDGMAFPAPPDSYPSKDAMGDYLEAYAKRFRLPVRSGATVERLTHEGGVFVIEAGGRRYEADNVVVAMSNFQRPRIPAFANELDADCVQLHSSEYRNLSQLRSGGVLIVGAGNSGAEIAMETARGGHATWLAGRDTGHLPFRLAGTGLRSLPARLMLRFVFHRVLTVNSSLGRAARRKLGSHGGPLIRVKPAQLAAAGVIRAGRIDGARDGKPVVNGIALDVANIIWCTGFHPGFSWIDLPILEGDEPAHQSGEVRAYPGLYFVGLHFLHAMSSVMVHGVGRDADRIAAAIAARGATGGTPAGSPVAVTAA
jgi:putative flavoprotein involved in K+ transport